MPRPANPAPQYHNNGNPVDGGKMYYFDTGTSTPLVTYSDSAETAANTHPVILSADGVLPPVFFTGTAKQRLNDKNDVQLWERDPVVSTGTSSIFEPWNASIVYSTSDMVQTDDGRIWISIADSNVGSDPTVSASKWSEVILINSYNVNESYSIADVVRDSTGILWRSMANSNIGNDPTTDSGANWKAAVPATNDVKTFDSTADLIATANSVSSGDVAFTKGYYSSNDGGHGHWIATGNVIAISQTPSLLQDAKLSDNSGNEYQLLFDADLNTEALGAGNGSGLAVSAALAACKNTGKNALLPLSTSVDFDGTAWVVEGCTLKGSGAFKLSDYESGGFVHTTDISAEVIALNIGGNVDGVNFYHPNQSLSATAVVYPPVIKLDNSVTQSANNRIINNTFVNSYIGIDLNGSPGNANVLTSIEHNRMCCLHTCILHSHTLTECFFRDNDVSYVHWQESVGQLVRGLINNSAVFIDLQDCDGTQISDNTVFGMGVGIKFSSTPALTNISSNMFDGCYRGFQIMDNCKLGTVNSSGNTISAKDPVASADDAVGLYANLTSGTITGNWISSGDLFTHADGDHVNILVTSPAASTVSFSFNGDFIAAGRNLPVGNRYGVKIVDQSSGTVLRLDGTFHDPVNGISGRMIGLHVDGLDIVKADAIYDTMVKGFEIGSLNAFGRHQMSGIFKGNTTDFTDSSLDGQTQIAAMYDSTTPSAKLSVASATTVVMPFSTFQRINVSGTTTITDISGTFYDDVKILVFNGAVTVTDGGSLRLAGSFNSTGGDTLTLSYDGLNWVEISRSVN